MKEAQSGACGAADIRRAGQLSVYELFVAQAKRDPNALAIEQGSLRRSYGALDERVRRLAAALRNRGIHYGERIALLSENRAEYIEIELAAACLGAVVACQNWRLAAAELQHCLDLVSPALVIGSRRFAKTLAALDLRGVRSFIIEDHYEALIETAPPWRRCDVDPEDGLVILYTSGTTGLPKGALISHRAEIARMALLRMDLRATEQDGFVAWAPMFHMGSTDQMLGALMSGATVYVVDGFNAEAIVDIMERAQLGWLLLMPGSIEPVVELLKSRARRPKGIRAVGAMADLVPKKLITELTGLTGAPYLNSFGATETGLAPASASLIPPRRIPRESVEAKERAVRLPSGRSRWRRRRGRRAWRGRCARSDGVQRLLECRRDQRARLQGRLVSHGRPVPPQRGRQLRLRRPGEIHDQIRRREHLSRRDRTRAVVGSARQRRGRHPQARRKVG